MTVVCRSSTVPAGRGVPSCSGTSAVLGRNVASQLGVAFEAVRYLGPPGLCPMCHLDVVALRGADVECATCGARGRLGPDLKVTWTDLSTSVISMDEKRAHAAEIQETAARHRELGDQIAERARDFEAYDPTVRPERAPAGRETEQLSRPVDGSRTDPATIGVYVDVAAAHDGDDVPASEAVTVFEDRRDAERGRWFDDQASVVEEHPHPGDDRRLLDQDGVVSDQEEVVQDGRDGPPAGDAVSDGAG
jgi:hypothetical protein